MGSENRVPNIITGRAGLLPCGCGMQSHRYFAFSFGNSCVSLFQRYFFLIYRIPEEGSISQLWHRLPPLNLGPDTHTHTYMRTHSHACTPAAQKQILTADHYSRLFCCLCCCTSTKAHTHKYRQTRTSRNTQQPEDDDCADYTQSVQLDLRKPIKGGTLDSRRPL